MRDAVGAGGVNPWREAATPLRFAGLVLDLDGCALARESGEAIPLTRGEFAVLRMFVARPGRVTSRDALLDAFASRRFEAFDRSVDVLVGKLRRKIEPDPKRPRLIVTVPGEGYRFDGLTQSLSSEQKPPIVVQASLDHAWLGLVDILTKRTPQGFAGCEHAAEPDRNLAYSHASIGQDKIFIGRAEETEAHIVEALRLSPRDTGAYAWMNMAGLAKNYLGLYDQAIPWFRRSNEANRNYASAYFNLAASLAQLGRLNEANSAVKAGLALNPAYSVSRVHAAWSARSDHPTYLAQIEPVLKGMRMAGVPEG